MKKLRSFYSVRDDLRRCAIIRVKRGIYKVTDSIPSNLQLWVHLISVLSFKGVYRFSIYNFIPFIILSFTFTIKTDHLEYRSLELWMKRLAWCWTVLVYATKRAAQVKNFGNNLEMILMRWKWNYRKNDDLIYIYKFFIVL